MPRRNRRLTRRSRKSNRQPNVEPHALTPDQMAVRLVWAQLASPLILHDQIPDFRTNRRNER